MGEGRGGADGRVEEMRAKGEVQQLNAGVGGLGKAQCAGVCVRTVALVCAALACPLAVP
jgi:hypothetical protein